MGERQFSWHHESILGCPSYSPAPEQLSLTAVVLGVPVVPRDPPLPVLVDPMSVVPMSMALVVVPKSIGLVVSVVVTTSWPASWILISAHALKVSWLPQPMAEVPLPQTPQPLPVV